MKKKIKKQANKIFASFIIFLTIFALCGLINLGVSKKARAADYWYKEIADSEGNVGQYTSLALDSSNNPHISYFDDTNDDLKYTYKSGGAWHTETVDSAGDVGEYTSLALDSSNNPHISYFDDTNDDLKYTYKSGGAWHTETVHSVESTGLYTSLALDSSNNPHISYYSSTYDCLQYAPKLGGFWHIQTADTVGGWDTSLALDSSNNPHISYYDAIIGHNNLKYAHKDGAWDTETADSTGWVGMYTSIALDSSNNPHISYFDDTNNDLKYTHKSGGSWNTMTVDSAGDVGMYTSLALDSSNNPHISYRDFTNTHLKYTHKSGGSWHTETVDSAESVGGYTSLALDSSNNPHISHYDFVDDNLRYTTLIDDSSSPTTASQIPVSGTTKVSRSTNISFELDDEGSGVNSFTLDVTIEGTAAITDGACQSGYSCTIDLDSSGGYDVTINPDSEFNYSQEVNISVSVSDNAGNPLSSFWLFTTEAEPPSDGDSSSSGGVLDERSGELIDLNPKILTTSGPGEPTRLQAYPRDYTGTGSALYTNPITNLFPSSYKGGAGIVSLDTDNNTVLDQIAIFALSNGGPQVRLFGPKSDGTLASLGQMFVFDKKLRDGLSATAGDFDHDGYKDDAAFCLTGNRKPTVRVYTDIKGIDNWHKASEFTASFNAVGCNLGTFQYDDGADEILVTPNHGNSDPKVYIYTANGTKKKEFMAYPKGVQSGVTASGIDDRIYTTPNNGTSQINVYDKSGNRKSFWWAYPQKDSKGNYIVKGNFINIPGDVDLDGKNELLISPIGKNGPQVLSFETNGKWKVSPNFFAFNNKNLRNGVGIAVIENWQGIN